MIGNLGINTLSFKGKIVSNKIFMDTLRYVDGEAKNKGDGIEKAERFSDAIEYILKETPSTDEFEFRAPKKKNERIYSLTLYKNKVPVETVSVNKNIDNDESLAVLSILEKLYSANKKHPQTKTTSALIEINKEKERLNSFFTKKVNRLKKYFDEQYKLITESRDTKIAVLDGIIEEISAQRRTDVNKRLKNFGLSKKD